MPNWDEIRKIKDNKAIIIAEKKSVLKTADAVVADIMHVNSKGEASAIKSIDTGTEMNDSITVRSVINTTNLIDSHMDCHIPGIWNKSVKESKGLYLLQEHKLKFDHIISDNVTPSLKTMKWSDLGYSFDGTTQALIFDSVIDPERNEYMYNQYLKGWVKNHSVGMRYVNLFLCINSKDRYYAEEKDNWDKYISYVANKSVADETGYFWAITEAKIIEGSAVPIGSNYATPTLNVKSEPLQGTQPDSRKSTINSEIISLFKNQLK